MNPSIRRVSIAALAVLLVAPAAAFFLSAVGRSLQPTNHEPSRTLDAIVTWFGALPVPAVVIVLMVLPFVGLVLAVGFLWRTWTGDEATRADVAALAQAGARVVRRPALVMTGFVVAFGVLYFVALTVHAVAG
jgi:hypothetical protein